MMNIKLTTDNRKGVAQRLAEITGEESHYTKVPRCAYKVGSYIIEKDGNVTVAEGADFQPLLTLAAEGLVESFEAPILRTDEEEEMISLTVEIPVENHTGATLRNLINLLYTRADLLNKALGTSFRINKGLTDALKGEACVLTVESLLKEIANYEDRHGKAIEGLTITQEGITFSSLPEIGATEKLRTFTILCEMMNKQALAQKRIQAKTANDENEKYALRIWLTRIGMNGPEYKEDRKLLTANLTGHCAFRTKAEEKRWKERQAKKRETLKAAKAAQETEEVTAE